jgi:hypothetical protein
MKWEYKIQPFDIQNKQNSLEEAENDLQVLGNDAWEIFAVIPGTNFQHLSPEGKSWQLIFAKRPVAPTQEP